MWLQLEYHPPELVAGGPPTACIDVWAIGITCWELLIGARPLSLEDLGGPLPAVQEWRGGNQFGQQCIYGVVGAVALELLSAHKVVQHRHADARKAKRKVC